jgi:hypothetical protein
MVWNDSLSRPFVSLSIGQVCPQLLQGAFACRELTPNYLVFLIVRRSRMSGIYEPDKIGNESEVEIATQEKTELGWEISSHVLRRVAANSTKKPEICAMVDSLINFYGVNEINVFDFNAEPLYIGKHKVNVTRQHFPGSLRALQVDLPPLITSFLHSAKSRSMLFRGFPTVFSTQSQLAILSCFSGCDSSNYFSFFYVLHFFAELLQDGDLCRLRDSHRDFVTWIGRFFMRSGDIIAKMYLLSQSQSCPDIREFIGENPCDPTVQDIAENRRRGVIPAFIQSLKLFTGVVSHLQCVSACRSLHVLSPPFDKRVFAMRPTEIAFPCMAQPLTIALARPTRLFEIVVRTLRMENPAPGPVSLSLDAGMYVNRMVRIFDAIALIRTQQGDIVRFPVSSEKVRFLRVTFPNDQGDVNCLGNLAFFGFPEPSPSFLDRIDAVFECDVGAPGILRCGNAEEWAPIETFIPMSVFFRHHAQISRITFSCGAAMVLEIDGEQYDIEPPVTAISVTFSARELSFAVMGSPIKIREIAFYGTYDLAQSEPPRPVTLQRSPELRAVQPHVTARFEGEGFDLRMPAGMRACGMYFPKIVGFDTAVITFQRSERLQKLEVRLPQYEKACHWLFPYQIPVDEFAVRFRATEKSVQELQGVKFQVPKVQILVVSRQEQPEEEYPRPMAFH